MYVVCNDCSKVIRPFNVETHSKKCKSERQIEKVPAKPLFAPTITNKKKALKIKKSIAPANVPPPPLFRVSIHHSLLLCAYMGNGNGNGYA